MRPLVKEAGGPSVAPAASCPLSLPRPEPPSRKCPLRKESLAACLWGLDVASSPAWAVSPQGYLVPERASAWHQCCPGRSRPAPQARGTCSPPPSLCATCPAGVSGPEPAEASAQLPYGKDGCKQDKGQVEDKGAGFVGASLNPRLLASHPTGAGTGDQDVPPRCGTQCRELPIYPPPFSRGCPGPPGSLPAMASTPGEALPASRGPGRG